MKQYKKYNSSVTSKIVGKKLMDAASWRVCVHLASLGLVVTQIYVQSLRRKNLEFFGRKLTWSGTELFDN